MRKLVSSIIIGMFLLINGQIFAQQDTLKTPIKIIANLCGDVSNVGFYGGIGAQATYNKIGFSLSYLVDYSKDELPINGPFGFNTSLSYYFLLPNKKIITPFVNMDYRILFHKRYCKYDCSKKYNKTHEITLGYGISLKVFKNISISNTTNVGWYIENYYSDRTGETIKNSGINTLVQTHLNFHF